MKGSEDKINSNRIRTDDSNNNNNNTNVLRNNNDKDQSDQFKTVTYEKRIIYFSKPLVNDGDEGDSNRSEKNSGNSQGNISQQKQQQQSSFDQEKIRARNNLLKQFFPDILKAIGNKAIKDNPPTLQELESYLQNYFHELQTKKMEDGNAKVQKYLSKSTNPTLSSQEYNNNKELGRGHYSKGHNDSTASVTTVNQKNYRLNFN